MNPTELTGTQWACIIVGFLANAALAWLGFRAGMATALLTNALSKQKETCALAAESFPEKYRGTAPKEVVVFISESIAKEIRKTKVPVSVMLNHAQEEYVGFRNDSDLLNWLQDEQVDVIHMDDGRIIDVRSGDLRAKIREACDRADAEAGDSPESDL